MSAKKYYVATCYKHTELFLPAICVGFEHRNEAEEYVELMSKTQGRDYIILEAVAEYPAKTE